MGRGNWIPDTCQDKSEYDHVYVDLGLDLGQEYESEEIDEEYQNLKDEVHSILGDNWRAVERYQQSSFDLGRDTSVWFECETHLIVIDNQGDFWHQGIAVISRENAPAFAEAKVTDIARKLWYGLHQAGYKLSSRDTAWTCNEYIPRDPKAKINPGTVAAA